MIGTKEQAQVYLAQGSLCRAAVIMQEIVATEPTTENLELLADIYAKQGLTEDALALYAKAISDKQVTVATACGCTFHQPWVYEHSVEKAVQAISGHKVSSVTFHTVMMNISGFCTSAPS
jgi:hypothetical protein